MGETSEQDGLSVIKEIKIEEGMHVGDLISIIIPVYNSAQYIGECIQSVLDQTYRCLEVLMIDDGSVDGSREICENISERDARFVVISQEHRGVSAARNRGLENATGQYLFFLDSDDVIHPRLLEELYLLLRKKKAGMAAVTHYCKGEEAFEKPASWKREGSHPKKNLYLNMEEAIDCLLYGNREAMLYIMGGKLIWHGAVQNVRFDEKLANGEDTLFIYQVIAGGASVSVLCCDWYYHREHAGGLSKNFTVSACQSRYAAYCHIRECEIKNARMSKAVACEKAILNAMIKWYKTGKSKQDDKLMSYVKELMKIEKRTELYARDGWFEKLELYLLFYCYPIYQPFYRVCSWLITYPRIKERLRKVKCKVKKK